MADNSGSNAVALVAIVVLVIVAIGGYFLFINKESRVTDVNVEVPAVSAPSTSSTTTVTPSSTTTEKTTSY